MRNVALVWLMVGCAPRPVVVWSDCAATARVREVVSLQARAEAELECPAGRIVIRDGFDGEQIASGCGHGAIFRLWRTRYGFGWLARERFTIAREAHVDPPLR
jgi:hypothetical protein